MLRPNTSSVALRRRPLRAALSALAVLGMCPTPATASDLPSPFLSGTFEMWSGGEGTRRSWSTYSGLTWSPFGKLATDGLRVRAAGGYGEYSYNGNADGIQQSIYGTAAFADLLVGYQMGIGPLTVKAFAGGNFDGHLLQPFDEANKVGTSASGAKVVLEAWYNVTDRTWAQLDLSWASAHSSYGGRLRAGYRVRQRMLEDLSIGVEAGAFGNDGGDNGRIGAFARYAWFGGEISASAGVSGAIEAPRNPYGMLVYLKRY